MDYADYLGNLARLAVEVANGGELSPATAELLAEHRVGEPVGELGTLPETVRAALCELVGGGPPDAVRALLDEYPPELRLSDHDGVPHIHHASDGLDVRRWIGQTVAAALAHVAAGDPALTLGRCAAEGCDRFFVDQSRNRTRRFCGNPCASRTTVAAHRARVSGRKRNESAG